MRIRPKHILLGIVLLANHNDWSFALTHGWREIKVGLGARVE